MGKIKKLLMFLLALGALILALGAHSLLNVDVSPSPKAYYVEKSTEAKWKEKALKMKELSEIWHLGDAQQEKLAPYYSNVERLVSKGLAEPLRVTGHGGENYGLHYHLSFLKAVPEGSWPKALIIFGNNQEFRSARFLPSSKKAILKNLKVYKDPRLKTLLKLYPFTAKFLFFDSKALRLSERPQAVKGPKEERSNWPLQSLIPNMALFNFELSELASLAKARGTKIILVSTPLNIFKRPERNCLISETQEIKSATELIEKNLNSSRIKEALKQSKLLNQRIKGNAQLIWLLGQSLLKSGDYSKAHEQLTLATAFDCSRQQGHGAINALLAKAAKKHSLIYIDYQKEILRKDPLGEGLFIGDNVLQPYYYELLAKKLATELRKQLL